MRYLSIQLPAFAMQRMALVRARQGQAWPPPEGAAGLVQLDMSAPRLTAVNAAAARAGIRPGMVLADARAILPALLVRDAEPEADALALRALAEWCLRYTPLVAMDGDALTPFALMLEITGCAHLMGGEAAMCEDIRTRLRRWGFTVDLATADSQARAWALARHGPHADPHDLPVAALRLSGELVTALRRLGLVRVGDLAALPQRSLADRFEPLLLERLNALLHGAPEPFCPLREVPQLTARLAWPEPIATTEAIEAGMRELVARIAREMERSSQAARRLRLICGRVDGGLLSIDLPLGQPQRDPGHIARLFALKLDGLDIGFGIEFMALEVDDHAGWVPQQTDLVSGPDDAELDFLIDQLSLRLGADRVTRLRPVASHIPERAQEDIRASGKPATQSWTADQPRPLRLRPQPDRIHAVTTSPDGPPQRIRIDGRNRLVVAAFGPERIEPEWWRLEASAKHHDFAPRDYWRVIDETGTTHWLYRAGHCGDARPPQWFRHGVFH